MREQIMNMLLTAIKESLGEEYLVDSPIIKKNNNTKKYAISIRKRNEQVAPILYTYTVSRHYSCPSATSHLPG